jgi:predicted KAP-like P-loop ATPase
VRVEEALGAGELDRGREHLEKIVQATFEVPSVRKVDLARVLLEETQAAIEGIPAGPFDGNRWQNVFALVIRPLLESMRDVRRYVNGLPHALATIGEEVALTDVLALEAVRVAAPQVAHRLPDLVTELTDVSNSTGRVNDVERAERIKNLRELISAGATHADAIEEMLRVLFPATQRYLGNTLYGPNSAAKWRSERLVAEESILRFYLERSLPKGVLGSATVRKIFDSLGDEASLRAAFAGMDPDTLEDALSRLEDFEDSYPPESVPVALPVVLDTLPRLREGNRPMFDTGAAIRVTRVALRLLKRVDDEPRRAEIAAQAITKVSSLSAALELVEMVGHREGVGHKLVTEADAARLEGTLSDMILGAGPSQLANERDLFLLWFWAGTKDSAAVSARLPTLINGDAFFVRFIGSALSESRSQSIGEVAVRREYRLPWDSLVSMLGEEPLSARIAAIDALSVSEERDRQALETAKRYSSGWRPERNF